MFFPASTRYSHAFFQRPGKKDDMDVPTFLTSRAVAAVEHAVGAQVAYARAGQGLSACHAKHEHFREIGRRRFVRISRKTEQVAVRDHVQSNPGVEPGAFGRAAETGQSAFHFHAGLEKSRQRSLY